MSTPILRDGIYLNADTVLGEADLRFVQHNRWGSVYTHDANYARHGIPLPAHASEWVRLADLPNLTKES